MFGLTAPLFLLDHWWEVLSRIAGEGEPRRASDAVGEGNPLVLALPDKPSIAVLPFQNMSGDPEQEYFVDGMAEEIITALNRIRWLFVIARNSSFTSKGQAIGVKQVGRDLSVRYVLERLGPQRRQSGTHHHALPVPVVEDCEIFWRRRQCCGTA
jgi:hypothetical protein